MSEREGVLSCSALPRVAACPASVPLCEGVAETPSSEWAEAGQDVHAVCVAALMGQPVPEGATAAAIERGQAFAQRCRQIAEAALGPDFEWHCEVRAWLWNATMTERVLTGRWDCAAVTSPLGFSNRVGVVIDLKTGPQAQFTVAPARRNLQLSGYALMLAEEFDLALVFGAILTSEHEEVVPVQIPHTRGDSLAWPHISAAAGAKGKPWHELHLQTGPHCQYCAAKLMARCPAHREALATVLAVDGIAQTLQAADGDTLARVLDAAEFAESLIRNVRAEAMRRLSTGGKVGRYEIGHTEGKRQVTNAYALAQKLVELGADPSTLTAALKLPVGDAEKIFAATTKKPPTAKQTKAAFADFAGDLIGKSEGGTKKLVRQDQLANTAE